MVNVQVAGVSYANYLASVAGGAGNVIVDPGDAGAIAPTVSGKLALTVASGVETRTLAAPTFVGQKLDVCLDINNGTSVAITVARTLDSNGNDVLTFTTEGSGCRLVAISTGLLEGAPDFEWRVFLCEGANAAPAIS